MIINHNIPAMNTNRYLSNNNNNVSKSLEKLSSGMRINRAGDDAAGLAISEKMRAQIRGLDMATKNAQDGVSLIQTAEGSMQTIENILQRMRELAVESSNDTNVNTNDREAIQLEVDALTEEIDRIAKQSEFNTQKLLDGSFTGKFFHIGANTGQNITVNISALTTQGLGIDPGIWSTKADTYNSILKNVASAKYSTHIQTSVMRYMIVSTGGNIASYATEAGAQAAVTALGSTKALAASLRIQHLASNTVNSGTAKLIFSAMVAGTASNGASVIAGSAVMKNSVGGKINLATQSAANKAIATINSAINKVSMQRAQLGAIQNRLEYSIENLEVSSENTSAAESRIRDVNMSKEMMNFTKNNILAQAATAMLAQANQTPQNVLSLLR